jgi:HEPN domain-containing protein
MNRYDLQKLSRLRVREAKVLLDNKCYNGAYYLLGYAVECALKACIARQTKAFDFPDRKLINDIYTHDLEKLLNASGLKADHQNECRANPSFQLHWTIVKDWSEQSRYMDQVSKQKAKDFRSALVSRKNGVLPWLQKRW